MQHADLIYFWAFAEVSLKCENQHLNKDEVSSKRNK